MLASTSTIISVLASLSYLTTEVQGQLLSAVLPDSESLAEADILFRTYTGLPTRRSTSQLSRRALPRRQQRPVAAPFEPQKRAAQLGDHSIVVDASSSASGNNDQEKKAAGITNSTINLTVISRRRSSPSTFQRLTRALFGSSFSSTSAPIIVVAPPTTEQEQEQARKPLGVHSHSQQLKARHSSKVIRRSKPAARKVERRAGLMVTDMEEQQSVYRAAVAALASPTVVGGTMATAQPVAQVAVSSASSPASASTAVAEDELAGSTGSSIIANPKSSLSASSPLASSSPIAIAEQQQLEPITLTLTLLPNPSSPSQYIDQAALLPLLSSTSNSASAEMAATTGAPTLGFRKARRSGVQVHRRKEREMEMEGRWVPYVHQSGSA